MSSFSCPVVRIVGFGLHPRADSLSITQVEGVNVIFKTGDFAPGDLAVYVPPDALVPLDDSRFRFLDEDAQPGARHRVRAVRLRGVLSEGLLVHPDFGMAEGEDVAERLGIEKYEEPLPPGFAQGNASDPGFLPVYGVEHYHKHKRVLMPGEEVVLTEKIHGCNARFAVRGHRLHVGSHKSIKAFDPENLWWKVALQEELHHKLRCFEGLVLYGEIYGQVQDLRYDVPQGEVRFRAFDLYDSEQKQWLDWDVFTLFCQNEGIPIVPVLYRGPYAAPEQLEALASGPSTIAQHIREGWVLRTAQERSARGLNRMVLKCVSEAYKTRKGGTEYH